MTLDDLKKIGDLVTLAGHNPDAINIFMPEEVYRKEFADLIMEPGAASAHMPRVTSGPLFLHVPCIARVSFAGYTFNFIDPKDIV